MLHQIFDQMYQKLMEPKLMEIKNDKTGAIQMKHSIKQKAINEGLESGGSSMFYCCEDEEEEKEKHQSQ